MFPVPQERTTLVAMAKSGQWIINEVLDWLRQSHANVKLNIHVVWFGLLKFPLDPLGLIRQGLELFHPNV